MEIKKMQLTKVTLLFFLSVIFISLSSCDSTTEEYNLGDQGFDYFPLAKNKFWIYKVDSLIYTDVGNTIDTTSSFLKEEITDVYLDQLADTIFVIERSFSKTDNYDWKITDIWNASKSEFTATKTEENLKFVKMTFPIELNKSWDGNAFINTGTEIFVKGESLDLYVDRWDYRVLDIKDLDTIDGVVFDDVVVIKNVESSEDEFINYRYKIEKYSKNIGLVYTSHSILDTNCGIECDTIPWEQKAHEGYILDMKLKEYGE